MKEEISEISNVHKLLRIVWVFVEHQCMGRDVEQGELPKEVAKKLSDIPEDQMDDKDKLNKKVDRPLTCDHVMAALERLDEILEPPWPKSNPCAGPRPKYRA